MTRLAMVMIARDAERSIARALKSARRHVDRMIVLDTGSIDGTREIAAAEGAEVSEFVWCDDFSAARNAALSLSDAVWNLVLDSDEWIAGGGEALKALPAAGGDFLGVVRLENTVDRPEEAGTPQAWLPRVLPRGVGYEGRIHEQPVGVAKSRRLALVLGHDGYTADSLERKGDRNEALLMRELEAEPQDAYLWMQLGREHQVRGRSAQAAVCLTEALRLAPVDAPYRHGLTVSTLIALKNAGRLEEALALADAEVGRWSDSPDFYFTIGDLYLACAQAAPERAAADFLTVVESAWKRCLELGDRPDLEGSVAGRGGHMAAHNLAVFYETLSRPKEAAEHRALARRLKRKLR